MKKERLIMVAGIVCLSLIMVVALPFRASPAPTKSIIWNASQHGTSRATTAGFEWWVKEMEARTDGRFKVKIHWGDSLSPMKENTDGLKAGLFEMALVVSVFHPGKTPLSTAFIAPFLTPPENRQISMWMMEGYKHPAIVKEWERWNIKILFPNALPRFEIMSKRPIRKVEDFNGLRLLGASGMMGTTLKRFGTVPVMVATSENYGCLEKGIADAVTNPWTANLGAFKLYEVTDYSIVGLGLSTGPSAIGVNKRAWDALPDDIKRVHEELMPEFPEIMEKAYAEVDAKFLPIIKKAHKEIIQFPPEERAKLVAEARKVWDEWANKREAEGLPGRDVMDYLIKLAEEVKAKY